MLALISAFGALQLLLIAFAFGFGKSRPRQLFAAFAAALSIVIAGAVVMETSAVEALPHLARVHLPFNYLLAPLFYLFVRAALQRETRRPWLHAIPAAFMALMLAPFYAMSGAEKLAAIASPDSAVTLRLLALLAQAGVYLAMTFKTLHGSRERNLWAGTITMTILWLAALARLGDGISPLWIPAAFALCASALVMLVLRGQAPRPKYARSTLTDDRGERSVHKLDAYVASEKPYLDPALTLDAVAEKLALSPNHLSQILNQRLGRNFNEWLNAHRVAEARRRLADPKHAHLSIVAIAEASGFRSKSTFNAVFRKETGMTPSEYRRRRPES